MPNLFFMFDLVLVVIFVPLRLQQGTDGQGNLLLLFVNSSDLRFHFLSHSEHIAGLSMRRSAI